MLLICTKSVGDLTVPIQVEMVAYVSLKGKLRFDGLLEACLLIVK